jgi:hypothetical protein
MSTWRRGRNGPPMRGYSGLQTTAFIAAPPGESAPQVYRVPSAITVAAGCCPWCRSQYAPHDAIDCCRGRASRWNLAVAIATVIRLGSRIAWPEASLQSIAMAGRPGYRAAVVPGTGRIDRKAPSLCGRRTAIVWLHETSPTRSDSGPPPRASRPPACSSRPPRPAPPCPARPQPARPGLRQPHPVPDRARPLVLPGLPRHRPG